jgi:hypothetical protein
MVFRLPKSDLGTRMSSAVYELLMPATLESTNVERLMVQLLERVVKVGRTSPAHTPTTANLALDALVDKLSKNNYLVNFDSEQGRSILEGWLRAVVVEMISDKNSPSGDQIDYLKLLSVASYRAGLPKAHSKHRKVDQLVYRSMVAYWLSNPGANAESMRRAIIEDTPLGHGLEFPAAQYPYAEPEYSGGETIDINALLELRFLEGIPGRSPVESRTGKLDASPIDAAVPAAILPVGKHMVDIMRAYQSWSASEITVSLTCIVALFMYQLPIRVGSAVRELLSEGGNLELLTDCDENPVQMYFDFTGDPSSSSSQLAKQCVARDQRILSNYFRDMVLLRETELLARLTPANRLELESLNASARLVKIAGLVSDSSVEINAGTWLETLEGIFLEMPETQDLEIFRAIRNAAASNLEALVNLILEDRRKIGSDSIRKWAASTGGLTKDGLRKEHALLSGTMAHSTTWKYSMSESMLLTLINLCYLDDKGRKPVSPALEMRVLLDRLERRFGVLISKVPIGLDSPEARRGASENLVAFISKLKTLGYFKGLSDDFSAQFIERPEAGN